MNKLFTKIAGLSIGLAMAIGVGVAVGSKEATNVDAATSTGNASVNLGSGSGSWNCGSSWSSSGSSPQTDTKTDALGNIWTLSYAYSSYSRTPNASYIQFGSSSKPAKSITLSTTMSGSFKVTNLYSKWGGFSGTAGTVTMKVGSTTVQTGSLSGTSDVEVKQSTGSYSSGVTSNTITIELTSIAKGIKLYSFSYTLSNTVYTVTVNRNNSAYGTISQSSVTNVAANTSISATGNTLQVGTTNVTATPAAQTDDYTYAFSSWTGIPADGKVTANVTVTANFTRTNRYSVGGTIINGSLSNTSRIEDGEFLEINIIPDSGYTYPSSISVTMGGNDISDDVKYEDGYLYYGPVTGNIVITATCPALGNIYSITTNVTNGTYSGDTTITDNGGVASVRIAPTGDYKLPASVSVSGADHTYNASTGAISLSNATGNVTISAAMVALTEYSITVNETNGSHTGASTIKESRSVSLTFEPDPGYGQPASVTVTGATYTWTRGTGVLSLSNPTGNVSVTYVASENELTSITLGTQKTAYILGEDFSMPVVTAHYSVADDKVVTGSATESGYDPYSIGNQSITISYTEGGITQTSSYSVTVSAKKVTTDTTWTRVTSINDLTAGTYIIGYEATAGSGTIVPLRSDGANATTTANGYFYTGTTADSSNNNTISIAKNMTSAGYEFTVEKISSDVINIKNAAGNYLGATSGGTTSNKGRLYTSGNSNETNFTVSYSSGKFSMTASVSGSYKYLKYNSGSPRYAVYNSSANDTSFYKKGTESTGSASLIRIVAEYSGGDKYVGDTIYATDFTVQKQLDTGTTLTSVTDFTINGESSYVLASTSNNITVSYTEGGVTKTATVVVSATEREASLEHVVLNVGENAKLDGYVYWSGAEWDLTDITVTYDWDDDDFDETVNLQDLVDSGDATLSPATPTLGATSFTVSYSYLEKNIENATVTLDEAVVADYVSSVSWSGKSLANFKAFSGQELTASTVNSWTVKATYAGAGETNALSFGTGANQFTIRIGDSKAVTSLPYTWTTADDNQFVYVVVGGVAKGDSTHAKTNICATINAIDHSETITGKIEKSVTWSKDDSIAAYGTTSLCDDGVALDENIFMQGAKGDAGTEIRFWSDGIRTYTGGNTLTFTPSNGAIITKITLPTVTVTSDSTSSASSPYTITDGDSAVVFDIGSKSTIGSDIVVEYTIEGSETTTVHYANQMEHFDAQKKVVEFAKFVNETMNGTNVCSGTFANLSTAWGSISAKYTELFGAGTSLSETELEWAQNMLRYANASWSSELEPACVERAMRTYEFCVANHSGICNAFMNGIRSAGLITINPLQASIKNSGTSIAIIAISAVSLVAIGGYFLFRKKKEN